MEFVVANAGKIKRETYNGRSYVVAPVTMIVPGVLNGSQGSLYYPPDEVAKDVGIWNAIPLTIGHPFDNQGQNVSARSPETLDKFQIGYVFNDRVENGNRLADGYFDVEWTKAKAPEVYKAINNGSPMELSTGLYTNNVPVDNGRSPKGDAYQFVARDYRPDHLAILPNQRGACSIKDGCGLNVNAESDINKKCGGDADGCPEIDAKATTTEAEKKHIADNAAPNQPKSLNTGKYKKHGAGMGKGEPHQAAQDGYHGGPKPCDCGGTCDECQSKLTSNSKPKRVKTMTRDESIKWLTTNCECHKAKTAVLANKENYTDAEIDALVKNEQGSQAAKLVVNGLAKVLPEIGSMAINEIPDFVKGKMKKGSPEDVAEDEADGGADESDEEDVVESKKKVNNAKQPTAQEWLDSAPAEIRELVGNALQQKADLVKKLTANTKNATLRDKLVKQYMQLSVNDLKDMIADMPKATSKPRQIVNEPNKPLYLGSFTPTNNEVADEADLLIAPTINWGEHAKAK